MIEQIAKAVEREVAMIMRLTTADARRLTPDDRADGKELINRATDAFGDYYVVHGAKQIFQKPGVVRRMLRVEYCFDVEGDILSSAQKHNLIANIYGGDGGPWQVQGVDMYLVRHLPAPGWRIVNPLKKA